MNTLQDGYRGATLILTLNWDRILSAAFLVGALLFGTWLGSL